MYLEWVLLVGPNTTSPVRSKVLETSKGMEEFHISKEFFKLVSEQDGKGKYKGE